MGKRWIWFLLIFIVIPSVLSHEDSSIGNEEHTLDDGDGVLISNSLVYIGVASFISFIFVIISVYMKGNAADNVKKILFLGIIIPIIFVSAYLIISTVYLNLSSETKGPVHWHADFEIWACGEKIHLPGPENVFDNKVGTAVFHHHDDDRIHVEGILLDKQDADLSQFFKTIGGSLTTESIGIPQHDKTVKVWRNGDLCGDQQASLKVYVNGKLNPEAEEYVISPYEQIPPGDCIIVDFSPGESETTEKVCETLKSKGGYEVYEK